ncbi:serine/threonine-protein kinase [Actinomadura oligospora]|uniref:serine/threonine-protein kinase n=1 Tax=Actinomadura oligospora TaxID=111804 RepID=UPI0004B251BB|nr:serine/threonine-protein kinase [Actinomadura oligospora]
MPDTTAARAGDPGTVGPYRLERRLGTGGQGTVHVALGPGGQRVAIKLLHPHLVADERARGRFLGEVEIAKRVAPFCTAPVLDSGIAPGVEGDRPYIVSEFVDGPSLHASVRTTGPRSGAALHRLAVNTASALAAIHEAGVVHRDFKPGNVLLGPDGPVVIDFGIARALDLSQSLTTSQAVGSPAYMAPEQIANKEIGAAADLFAWAATLLFAATGRRAFGGDSIPAVMHAILHDEPDLPDLDEQLSDLVRACLAKDPADRPTAVAVLDALRGPSSRATPVAAPVPAPAVPDEPSTPDEPSVPARTMSDDPSAPGRTVQDESPAPARTVQDEASTPSRTVQDDPSSPARAALDASSSQQAALSPGGDADGKAPGRSRRRVVLLTAAVAALVLAASGAAYMAGTAGDPGGPRAASGPTPLASGATTAPTPSSAPSSGKPAKKPSSGSSASNGPVNSSGPSGNRPTQPSGKSSRPPKSGGGGSKPGNGTKTLGTVGKADMDRYCNAKGQAYSMQQGGHYYCAVPSSIPVTWTDVCKWRNPGRSPVFADGTTCKTTS